MFDCGELTGKEAAQDVKKMDRLFQPFLLATSRNKYNKIKAEKAKEHDFAQRTLKPRNSGAFLQTQPNLAEDEEDVVAKKDEIDDNVDVSVVGKKQDIGNVSGQVVKRRNVFEVIIDWPEVMTNPKLLLKAWLTKQFQPLQDYHPKIGGFEKALKELRAEKLEQIQSFCHIQLLFSVESHVLLKKMLNFGEGMRVFYVELKAPDNKYVKSDDIEEIVVN
ncbi:hypothetical protein FGB62_404g01 [Gracilaria domingensis]|nr:hypothetical protein FGB62_404g01 [Gracilaria domingensis]